MKIAGYIVTQPAEGPDWPAAEAAIEKLTIDDLLFGSALNNFAEVIDVDYGVYGWEGEEADRKEALLLEACKEALRQDLDALRGLIAHPSLAPTITYTPGPDSEHNEISRPGFEVIEHEGREAWIIRSLVIPIEHDDWLAPGCRTARLGVSGAMRMAGLDPAPLPEERI